jgi:hypothetical protein
LQERARDPRKAGDEGWWDVAPGISQVGSLGDLGKVPATRDCRGESKFFKKSLNPMREHAEYMCDPKLNG